MPNKCYCGEPAFAVVYGEEGFIVCFNHFFGLIKQNTESSLRQGVDAAEGFQVHCFFKDGEPVYLPFASYLQLGQGKHCFDKSGNWTNIEVCNHEFEVAKAYESDPEDKYPRGKDQFRYCKHCGVWKPAVTTLRTGSPI